MEVCASIFSYDGDGATGPLGQSGCGIPIPEMSCHGEVQEPAICQPSDSARLPLFRSGCSRMGSHGLRLVFLRLQPCKTQHCGIVDARQKAPILGHTFCTLLLHSFRQGYLLYKVFQAVQARSSSSSSFDFQDGPTGLICSQCDLGILALGTAVLLPSFPHKLCPHRSDHLIKIDKNLLRLCW